MYANAQALHKQVESKKKAAKKTFSAWLYNALSRDKKKLIRNESNDTQTKVKAEDMPISVVSDSSRSSRKTEMLTSTAAATECSVQQQNYLRAQLTEMKRQAQDMLLHPSKRANDLSISAVENKSMSESENINTQDTKFMTDEVQQSMYMKNETIDNQVHSTTIDKEFTSDTQRLEIETTDNQVDATTIQKGDSSDPRRLEKETTDNQVVSTTPQKEIFIDTLCRDKETTDNQVDTTTEENSSDTQCLEKETVHHQEHTSKTEKEILSNRPQSVLTDKAVGPFEMKLEVDVVNNQCEVVSAPTSSSRISLTEELDRRLSHAALLYEEAITALDDVLHPSPLIKAPKSNPMLTNLLNDTPPTRDRRVSSIKSAFAKPDNEWI